MGGDGDTGTVGFVDGDAGEFPLVIDRLEVPAEGLSQAELGRDVEESCAWMAAPEIVHDGIAVWGGSLGVDGRDFDVRGLESVHLIFHEREKRGDDNRNSMINNCW